MNKIILLAVVSVLMSVNLSAEVICMKNSKKFKVSQANKVNVKAPQFLTTADSTCPEGYTELIALPDQATTLTGSWNLAGSEHSEYAAEGISFPEPLNSAPTQVVYIPIGGSDPTCTGSSVSPTAPAGVLCIYETFQSGMKVSFADRYKSFRTTDNAGGFKSASEYGAALYGYPQAATDFYAWGTWAVTKN